MELSEECTLYRLSENFNLTAFDCGNPDLNDFLRNDALQYARELLGVTYIFTIDKTPEQIACFFTVSNDSLKIDTQSNNTRRKVNKRIPHPKQMRNYPAVKIGRLGVNSIVKGQRNGSQYSVGDQLMMFLKAWFINDNKTGCRFLLVDAYNEPKVLSYYQRNSFEFLLPEADETRKDKEGKPLPLRTRIMYFDLMQLVS